MLCTGINLKQGRDSCARVSRSWAVCALVAVTVTVSSVISHCTALHLAAQHLLDFVPSPHAHPVSASAPLFPALYRHVRLDDNPLIGFDCQPLYVWSSGFCGKEQEQETGQRSSGSNPRWKQSGTRVCPIQLRPNKRHSPPPNQPKQRQSDLLVPKVPCAACSGQSKPQHTTRKGHAPQLCTSTLRRCATLASTPGMQSARRCRPFY